MTKQEIIQEIIKMQTEKLGLFVEVAKENELNKLIIGELNHILFISSQVEAKSNS